jgi:osmotically-inducible protein OsmY
VSASDVAPDPYLVERVRNALAEDPRVGELGIDVAVEGTRLVLAGEVATDERRDAVAEVALEQAPGHHVDNRVTVVALAETGEAETVP